VERYIVPRENVDGEYVEPIGSPLPKAYQYGNQGLKSYRPKVRGHQIDSQLSKLTSAAR
jgi:hypothetical protein